MSESGMDTILIGLDDTDNETSPGTGNLARALWSECHRRGYRPTTVSRHQFLVDPRIPYTSHNSGACVAVETREPAEAFLFAAEFVGQRSAPGSDPGVCVASMRSVTKEIVAFGRRAAEELVTMAEAHRLASTSGVYLRELGGTGLGIIGALGSVGLRADGNDGRIIDLHGLRELPARVSAEDLTQLGIAIRYMSSRKPDSTDAYETLDWVRPRLEDGLIVWPVEWSDDRDAWVPIDRKRSRPLS